ncbi:DUF2537 domain-containing protein [Actinokineospora sp. NBRC 105648]|uniref:DUF2537 domain-containing protein n=1 Tax=Actinokineospora sp. NBRC 105648 TaxID=3032206 RepID=UPI00249FF134|nr:DUF2537 domain-containing protein [Actinokineospora sp. NBRC 105648]GLZ42587.1 hypothetical protein Acsp05_62110 [Actinokineospora sp. NBRC 105648]
MELRVKDDHAVLTGDDGTGVREVDPHTLPLGADLAEALHEWARVVGAVRRGAPDDPATEVVSRRGHRLAERVAGVMGAPISYVDPLSGKVSVVEPPVVEVDEPQVVPATEAARAEPAEPTPWATGLLVAAFVLALVLFAVLTLALTLYETNPFLAVASNLVVSAGLLPSVWLARRVPTWRWVAVGVAGGIALGWLALPFIVFS